MKKQTLATLTNYQQPDAYGALSMPVYHCCAFEFDTAKHMTDAFTGRVNDPEYVRVMNPTVTFFENRVKSLTGASVAVLGIILPIYTIIDMVETAENVWSDSCVCAMVDNDETE